MIENIIIILITSMFVFLFMFIKNKELSNQVQSLKKKLNKMEEAYNKKYESPLRKKVKELEDLEEEIETTRQELSKEYVHNWYVYAFEDGGGNHVVQAGCKDSHPITRMDNYEPKLDKKQIEIRLNERDTSMIDIKREYLSYYGKKVGDLRKETLEYLKEHSMNN